MKRIVLGATGAATLMILGAGAAFAANSGSLNASTSGASTSGGTYNFKSSSCAWGDSGYDGRVAGTLKVTSPKVHLNAKVDGYEWVRIKQANSSGSYSYASCLAGRAVLVHGTIAIQVCKEKTLADDCSSKTARR